MPQQSTLVISIVAAVSAGALAAAYVAQYGFNLWPCQLCLYQRLPYAATLALGLLALMPAVDGPSKRRVLLLCAALFAVNAVIAFFHVGVEEKWWAGPSGCVGGSQDFSAADLLAAVSQPGRTGCEEAAFRFLGLSMAGYNVIVCAILARAGLWAARRKAWWTTP